MATWKTFIQTKISFQDKTKAVSLLKKKKKQQKLWFYIFIKRCPIILSCLVKQSCGRKKKKIDMSLKEKNIRTINDN